MSAYSLTQPSELALKQLFINLGSADAIDLHLLKPECSLIARLDIERVDSTLAAGIRVGPSYNTLTLQDADPANAQHLADYIEAIANGTADTAEEAPLRTPAYAAHALLPCWKCKGEAIGFDYCAPGPGTRFMHGAQCRHNNCQRVMECESEAAAADRWNAIQAGAGDHVEQPRDMVNHPPHYNGHPSGVECIEVTEQLPFNLGNAFKYVFRHRAKNGREDLEKARWYLARELSRGPRHDMPEHVYNGLYGLAERIAAHEPYPIGAALVAIAFDTLDEAARWVDHLIASTEGSVSEQQEAAA